VGLDTRHLVEEALAILEDCADVLKSYKFHVPVFIKLNALVTPLTAMQIGEHRNCAGLICSNSIPWGQMKSRIDWEGLFGSHISPLSFYGGGGLSGKPLLPIVRDWISSIRGYGFEKPIIGGGGVLSAEDADVLLDAGATAIELGSVSILRPWRVRSIIQHVNKRLNEKDRANGDSDSDKDAQAG
jgi:dihydroorotate dehydrogenase